MSKRERKPAPGFSNFGFSTILLSFVMICIVTIAALSLLTANSDYKLSQKVAEKNTAFYEAEHQAYEVLSNVDSALAQAYDNSTDCDDFYQNIEQALTKLDYGTYNHTTSSYTYSIPIAQNQHLLVELSIQYPDDSNDSFLKIITWKSVYDEVEIDEGTLDLID